MLVGVQSALHNGYENREYAIKKIKKTKDLIEIIYYFEAKGKTHSDRSAHIWPAAK